MGENMKILFIGGIYPKNKEKEYYSNSKIGLQAAANAWQWNLVEGFEHNLEDSIDILSAVFIPPFPKGYKKPWIDSYFWSHTETSCDYNVSFLNILVIKNFFREINIKRYIKKWIQKHKDQNSVIVVYSPHVPFLKSLKIAKKHRIKTCLIVPDLPQFTGTIYMKNPLYRIAKKLDLKLFKNSLKYIDKFVLFTKGMADKLECNDNYIVVEGIADKSIANYLIEEENNTKTVLYSGTLHARYGIKVVVDAFQHIDDPNYRLIICGDGDSIDYIQERAKVDNRIIFMGVKSRTDVIELQRKSTLLINPRPNNEEFTKYSFPSKTMEYMLSGKPVLCFKLDGIPTEYDDYLIYLDKLDPEAIATKIVEIAELEPEIRKQLGEKSRDYVVENKNKEYQTQRIIRYILENRQNY